MGRALGRCYADTNLNEDADADGLDAEECTKNMYREVKDERKKQLAACGDVRSSSFCQLASIVGLRPRHRLAKHLVRVNAEPRTTMVHIGG